ncbi:MAG: hypothetical protein ACJ76H_09850 [Bacteriovoracaceae bacterium]
MKTAGFLAICLMVSFSAHALDPQVLKAFRQKVATMTTAQKVKARIKAYDRAGDCLTIPVDLAVDVLYEVTGPYDREWDSEAAGERCELAIEQLKILNERH